jgi:hypothetical protein
MRRGASYPPVRASPGRMSSAEPSSPREGSALNGLGRLMTMAFEGVDLDPLAARLIARAASNEGDAEAVMDLSTILQLRGHRDLGVATQAHALTTRRLYELRSAGDCAIRLLAIMSPGDLMTNTPLEFLVAGSDVSLSMLYLTPGEPIPSELPPHDVAFIAVSHSEPVLPLLAALAAVTPSWRSRVVNSPARIPETARTRAFRVLAGAPGIVIPMTARVTRTELARISIGELPVDAALADGSLPLIVRPVDSHAGNGLEKIASLSDLAAYLSAAPADEFFISRFVDYRSEDGFFRKYRVVLIDGVAFPVHMGVSEDWMIHYLNAGMTDSEAKRAEEARFMGDFKNDFGGRHAVALQSIAVRFGLDYLVIDCGETAAGDLLVFEVCTGAIVHAMDPVEIFPYKRPHMDDIFAAFRAMLGRAIGAGGSAA